MLEKRDSKYRMRAEKANANQQHIPNFNPLNNEFEAIPMDPMDHHYNNNE